MITIFLRNPKMVAAHAIGLVDSSDGAGISFAPHP